MKRRQATGSVLAFGLTATGLAQAQTATTLETEVDGLLDGIERSACEFYRNGTWHNAQDAKQHLRRKFDYLVARHQVATAEEFIDRVATKSSLSGQAYQVRCGTSAALPSSDWMRARLAERRAPR